MLKKLFQPIDNAPLIIFRIFLGFLLAAETFGAILTGWVKRVLIEPEFTFSHIGLEWLQPLPGYGMYFYFALMGVCGILVMLGYRYRLSLGLFTLLWTGVYLMQKTSYNNHYYLLILVCLMMLFLPANKYASLDVKNNPSIKQNSMPLWCSAVMIFQMAIVYFFATVAKFYPGWLDGSFTKLILQNTEFEYFKTLFSKHWFHLFIAYSGIFFDMLIVPLLLWRKTRTIAFFAAIFFHIFNAIFLQIGIFPFFALSFVVFFYPPEKIRSIFFKKKIPIDFSEPVAENKSSLYYFFVPFFIIQLILPIRHHFIKGDVLWTEEGHRLSWRMMLRQRQGYTAFRVINKETQTLIPYDINKRLVPKQLAFVGCNPDGIWQMAQIIKKEFNQKGIEVSVFANTETSINGGTFKTLINPETDLAEAKWNYFFHNDWILLYDDQGKLIK
ncbi:HTTM domain-containing protein [Flavobacterium sp. PLA-1-15]|uniref:HTTM domain-containing protein n=1 Tax=Flavobacterium sp. PLA-1-15 TaxID=3380533 RepID=UPI003B78512F